MSKVSMLKELESGGFNEEDLVVLSFSDLIDIGEQLRELHGNFDAAGLCFEMALADAEYNDNLADVRTAYGQLGLTHRHAGEFEKAEWCYNRIIEFAEKDTDKAAALRHLADLDYLRQYYRGGFDKAYRAYKLALADNRDDLVWFSHGVVKILIALLGQWLKREAEDLAKALKNKSINNIKRRVWQTGYLGDRAKIFLLAPFGWFHGLRGALLSRFHSLALRKKR